MLMALFATLPGVALAAAHYPNFMPCCRIVDGVAYNMVCCIVNISMECCKRFLS
jgi:hypothetical protein